MRVRPDAERECENGNRRERRVPAKLAVGESNVLCNAGQPLAPRMVSRLNAGATLGIGAELVRVAEASQCLSLCVRFAHAERAKLLGAHLEVQAHLFVHLMQDAVTRQRQTKESASAARKPRKESHG